MKVLFISTGDSKYGAPKSMMKLMQTLIDEYGLECVLLTKKHNKINDWCDLNQIENYSMRYRDIMAGNSYETWVLNSLKHFVKYVSYIIFGIRQSEINKLGIDFSSIDLIHSNSNRVDIGAYASKRYNIPHIWHLREMDEGTKNMHYYMKNWQGYMNDSADYFIAITESVRNSWVRHGLDPQKISVVYNGIDPSSIEMVDAKILSRDIIRVVSVGRVERAKGQLDFVRAICLLPIELQKRIEIDFIGDYYHDYKRCITREIRKQGCISKVCFKGYCGNVGHLLKNYDIGITCSTAEAFGRTTIEYMMSGILTIASDAGANSELIINNETGVLYPLHDYKRLSDLISEIDNHREKYRLIAEHGRMSSVERFDSKYNAQQIYNLYGKAINE